MYTPKNVTPAVAKRRKAELAILKATVEALLDAGFTLSVFDGEEDHLIFTGGVRAQGSNNPASIYKALYETDEDYLNAWKDGHIFGWVRFIYGESGWDVISDYTTNLEPYIGEGTAVQKLIDKYMEGE